MAVVVAVAVVVNRRKRVDPIVRFRPHFRRSRSSTEGK